MRRVKHLKIDYSSLSCWRKCPEMFHNLLVRRFKEPVEAEPLLIGTAVHSGLEAMYSGDDWRKALTEAVSSSDLGYKGQGEKGSLPHLVSLLEEYENYYGNPDHTFVPLKNGSPKIEMHLEKRVTELVTFQGKVDMLVKDGVSGNLICVDHKTTSDLRYFQNKADNNDQATGYMYLCTQNGYKCTQFAFNVLTTATRFLGKPHKLFARHLTTRNDWHFEDFQDRLLRDAVRIVEDLESGMYSANKPDACTLYNRLCPYYNVCSTEPVRRQEFLENQFITNPWEGLQIEWKEDSIWDEDDEYIEPCTMDDGDLP